MELPAFSADTSIVLRSALFDLVIHFLRHQRERGSCYAVGCGMAEVTYSVAKWMGDKPVAAPSDRRGASKGMAPLKR